MTLRGLGSARTWSTGIFTIYINLHPLDPTGHIFPNCPCIFTHPDLIIVNRLCHTLRTHLLFRVTNCPAKSASTMRGMFNVQKHRFDPQARSVYIDQFTKMNSSKVSLNLEAIASRLEAIASLLEAIASRLEVGVHPFYHLMWHGPHHPRPCLSGFECSSCRECVGVP